MSSLKSKSQISAWMTGGYKLCEGTDFVSLVLHFQHLEQHLSFMGTQWILNTWICWRRWNLSRGYIVNLPLSLIVLEISHLTACLSDYPCHPTLTPWLSSPPSQNMFGKGNKEIKEIVVNQKSHQEEWNTPGTRSGKPIGWWFGLGISYDFSVCWYVPVHGEKWEFL